MMPSTRKTNNGAVLKIRIRRRSLKPGNKKWFDILTAVWAIALVVAALTWVASPAFARPGGGDGGCWSGCEEFCSDSGGCDYVSPPVGGWCRGKCENGDPYREMCGSDV